MTVREIVYTAGPTFQKFHVSTARRRGVMGPVGSGKSTGMFPPVDVFFDGTATLLRSIAKSGCSPFVTGHLQTLETPLFF